MIWRIYSNVDGQLMHFAQEIDRETEENACARAITVLGMMYHAMDKKTSENTWKELLHQNGYHVRKKR
jgi:hypothetical protein